MGRRAPDLQELASAPSGEHETRLSPSPLVTSTYATYVIRLAIYTPLGGKKLHTVKENVDIALVSAYKTGQLVENLRKALQVQESIPGFGNYISDVVVSNVDYAEEAQQVAVDTGRRPSGPYDSQFQHAFDNSDSGRKKSVMNKELSPAAVFGIAFSLSVFVGVVAFFVRKYTSDPNSSAYLHVSPLGQQGQHTAGDQDPAAAAAAAKGGISLTNMDFSHINPLATATKNLDFSTVLNPMTSTAGKFSILDEQDEGNENEL